MKFARTQRRAPGEDFRDGNAERVYGPWHVQVGGPTGTTMCGAQIIRIISTKTRVADEWPEGDRCPKCVRALKRGRPYARRKR